MLDNSKIRYFYKGFKLVHCEECGADLPAVILAYEDYGLCNNCWEFTSNYNMANVRGFSDNGSTLALQAKGKGSIPLNSIK